MMPESLYCLHHLLLRTVYSKLDVKSGQNVKAGQKIAEMGSTGTTRTMLEFQVRLDGKPINPTTVLPNN